MVRAAEKADRMRPPECSMAVQGPPSVADAKRDRRLPGIGKNPRAGVRPETAAQGPRAISQLTRNPEMPAFKMSVARISAGLAASALLTPALAVAAALAVNGERPLNITTPPGFTYVVTGADGSLSVPIDGFLFCANVYSGETPPPRQV